MPQDDHNHQMSVSAAGNLGFVRGFMPAALAVIACLLAGGLAYSGVFDMFSFFGNKTSAGTTVTVVDPSVGAELKPATELPPEGTLPAEERASCMKMRYSGNYPNFTFEPDDRAEGSEKAFVVRGYGDGALAFINSPDGRFNIWTLNPDNLEAGQEISVGRFHPQQDAWTRYYIADIACLPNNRLLIAVGYRDPRPKAVLLLYDITASSLKLIADAEPDTQGRQYYDYAPLSGNAAIAIYYTGMRRQAAEIYFNDYNHMLLFTPAHPDGLEILKMGIDDGNIRAWSVVDRVLYLKTVDERNQQRKEGYWSLDLSRVLN
jgi:hypothetical protein